MAEVPARFIKNKVIDYEQEIFSCLNLPFRIAGYRAGFFHRLFRDCRPNPLEINPPSVGVFSLLECIDSMFIKDFVKSDAFDFCRALYISYYGRDAAMEVKQWINEDGKKKFKPLDKSTWLFWDRKVALFADKINAGKLGIDDIVAFRKFLTVDTFAGYEMIPDSGGSFMPYLFGAETIAGIAMMSEKLNCTYDQVIWDVPLCLIGQMTAVEAKRNGIKGISRPKDDADVKLQLKLAREREEKGQLHPWQIEFPEIYPLTEKQKKIRPESEQEYADAYYKKLGKKAA